jgi:hypothetical protein
MKRRWVGKWISSSYLFSLILTVALSASCRKLANPTTAQAARGQSHAQPTANPESSAQEQSCQAFVQKFYDWYWNQFADWADDPKFDHRKLHWYNDALKRKPPVLSQELIRLIKKDQECEKEAKGICNLDFDPFLNSQAARGKYLVNGVTFTSARCKATIENGHEVAELVKSGSSWEFVNFHYSFLSEDGKKFSPDDDLVHILSQ